MVEEIINLDETIYVYKACSDKYGASEELEKIGCRVEYVGPVSTEFIRQGYTVFNWLLRNLLSRNTSGSRFVELNLSGPKYFGIPVC